MPNEPKISHILGVDYGIAKVGLAMADSETRLAFAYGTIDNNKELLAKLTEIIEKENITKVIIGMPSYINDAKKYYDNFGKALGEKIPKIKIEFASEMFTTKMAQDNLKEKGIKNIARLDDQEAARIILQGWLDNSRKSQI